jgi:DNA mismatch repair ATPase MutS
LTARDRAQFVDAATGTVLGVDAYLGRLDPDSDRGREALEAPRSFGPDQRTAWQQTIDRLEGTERWLEAHADAHRDARRALGKLPDIRKVATRLSTYRADRTDTAPLRTSELFQLKQFTYFGQKILASCEGLAADFEIPATWSGRLAELSETIHPGGSRTPRYHLAGDLDAELQATLDEKTELEETLRRTREPLEEAVLDTFDGSFGLDGSYRPGPEDEAGDLNTSDLLERVDGDWRLADDEVRRLDAELDALREDLDDIEHRVRGELTDEVAGRVEWLERVADRLCDLDVALAKVRLRHELGGCWGAWQTAATRETASRRTRRIVARIDRGWNPELEAVVEESEVQAIDFELGKRPAVVTGPNMGGKSSLLVLVGLCQWCAQHAMPVPANAFDFRPVERIVYVGSEEPSALDASEGLSAFGREIRRLVDFRDRAAPPTLWLLDEIGRGTHPDDGADLANRVIGELYEVGHRVLAATHFPDVATADPHDARQIRGIVDPDALEELLDADATLEQMERRLREAMDFQPVDTDAADVPRGAKIVARALGLDADENG